MKNLKYFQEFVNEANQPEAENYNNIAYDIARNFKKITSVDLKSMFDKDNELDDTMVTKTWPKIKAYVDKKYDLDITKHSEEEFLYILDDVITNFYVKGH